MLVLPAYAVPVFVLVLLLCLAGAVWRSTRS